MIGEKWELTITLEDGTQFVQEYDTLKEAERVADSQAAPDNKKIKISIRPIIASGAFNVTVNIALLREGNWYCYAFLGDDNVIQGNAGIFAARDKDDAGRDRVWFYRYSSHQIVYWENILVIQGFDRLLGYRLQKQKEKS